MLFKKSVRIYDIVFRRINYYTPNGSGIGCRGCENFSYSGKGSCKYVDLCSHRIPGNYGDCEKERHLKYVL